jgi:sugar lactone lactonase YvrE
MTHGCLRTTLAVTLAFTVLVGCSQELKPVFDAQDPSLVWPAGAGPARVAYVGALRTSSDLKPPRKPFQGIGELLVGAKPAAPMYGPRAVVCTSDGQRVWVADPGGRCLHVFDLQTREYQKIVSLGGVPLLSPVGVCLGPAGSVFVCDSEGGSVHRVNDQTGELIASLRLPADVRMPVAVAFDPSADELFVVDTRAHDVKVLTPEGGLIRIIGRRGEAPGTFNFPTAAVFDGELLWVVDTGNSRVQGVTRTGEPVSTFGQAGDAPGDFALPKGIAIDADGDLWVVDARFENVQIFDRSGRLLLVIGQEGTRPGEFWLPGGVFADAQGRVWVCDAYNRRVQVFRKIASQTDDGGQER